jgi:hypothetical protein
MGMARSSISGRSMPGRRRRERRGIVCAREDRVDRLAPGGNRFCAMVPLLTIQVDLAWPRVRPFRAVLSILPLDQPADGLSDVGYPADCFMYAMSSTMASSSSSCSTSSVMISSAKAYVMGSTPSVSCINSW